jgi:hypothetical protein
MYDTGVVIGIITKHFGFGIVSILFPIQTICSNSFSSYRTDWLNGSGGIGETLFQLCTISGKTRLRGAAEPLSDEIVDGSLIIIPSRTGMQRRGCLIQII